MCDAQLLLKRRIFILITPSGSPTETTLNLDQFYAQLPCHIKNLLTISMKMLSLKYIDTPCKNFIRFQHEAKKKQNFEFGNNWKQMCQKVTHKWAENDLLLSAQTFKTMWKKLLNMCKHPRCLEIFIMQYLPHSAKFWFHNFSNLWSSHSVLSCQNCQFEA